MNNNDLFLVLRTFSKEELKKFKMYLESPYFNKSRKLVIFYKEVKKYYPMFSDIRLSNEALHRKVSPMLPYKDSTIRNLFCDLHKTAINFLALETFKRKSGDKKRYLLEELNNRKLSIEFIKTIHEIELRKNPGADWNYFLNSHFIETAKLNFSYLNDKVLRRNKLNEEITFLNKSTSHLAYFYITELAANYLGLLVYSHSYNFDISTHWLYRLVKETDFKKIKEIFKDDKIHIAILDIYIALMEAFSKPEEPEKYHAYRKIVEKNIALLSKDEISFHYYNFMSYSTSKIMSPKQGYDFNIELFDIYIEMLKNNYYIDSKSNHLTHGLYRNILRHGLKLKEYSWVHDFITVYSTKVHPDDMENMKNYGMAYLSYNMNDYGSALKYIQEIKPDFFIHKFDIKNLTLMIYYELGYTEECLYLCKTYMEFLRNNKILNPERRKRYIYFVKFLEKLVLFNAGTIRNDLGYIRHRLIKNDSVAFKDWLSEKINMLGNRTSKAV